MENDDLLTNGEEAIETLHPHWKVLVVPVAVAVVVLAALLVVEAIIPSGGSAGVERLGVLALAIVFWMWWLVVPLLRWRTTTYGLTTRRVRIRTGILVRNGRDFPLSRIVNISYRTSLLDRVFGSGTVVLETAGEHGDLALEEIPHVQRIQSTLFQLVEDERLTDGEERPATLRVHPPGMRRAPGMACSMGDAGGGSRHAAFARDYPGASGHRHGRHLGRGQRGRYPDTACVAGGGSRVRRRTGGRRPAGRAQLG